MNTQSPQLTQCYRELQTWIEAGCSFHSTFTTALGLCTNVCEWQKYKGYAELLIEMRKQFEAAGLDSTYPFNSSPTSYAEEVFKTPFKHYQNPARLAWIKEHASWQ